MEIERYYCGQGEGMFTDEKGQWIRYVDHKKIIDEIQTRAKGSSDDLLHDVVDSKAKFVCSNCGCPKPKKTYDGWWCSLCDNEM